MALAGQYKLVLSDEERRHRAMRTVSEWLDYYRRIGNQLGAGVADTYLRVLREGGSPEQARHEVVAEAKSMYDRYWEAEESCQ